MAWGIFSNFNVEEELKQSDTKADHCMKTVDLGIFLKCEWAVQRDKG